MKVRLESIAESEFRDFIEALLQPYIEDRALADHISPTEAERFARLQHQELLPQGFSTPGHRFLRIIDDASDAVVGTLWLFLNSELAEAFIYDISISLGHRRSGYASAALRLAEAEARVAGCRRVSLNVFAPNRAAQELYLKLGYQFVSHHMNRPG